MQGSIINNTGWMKTTQKKSLNNTPLLIVLTDDPEVVGSIRRNFWMTG